MQVTKNITLDLLETGSPVIIKAKQNDRNTRYIAAHLYVDGLAYPVPSGTEIAFRYKKPDGTAGFYDALQDNSPAITVSGNTVTVELVEQVLTVSGCVHCEINMYNATSEKLTTFTFEISVEESVLTDAEIISSDYYNVLTAEITKALQAVTDATEQAENAAQSAQDAADSAAMSKDWAAGQPVTYSGTPVSIAYAGAQRIAAITAYGENAQGGTTEAPVALTGVDSVFVSGNNLLPKAVRTETTGGITFTPNPDGSILVSGTATTNVGYSYARFERALLGRTVCLSGGSTQAQVLINERLSSGAFVRNVLVDRGQGISGILTKQKEDNILYATIQVLAGTTVNTTIYPMLNLGESPLPYEPYWSRIIPLPIPRPLRRVGDVRDVCVTRQEYEGTEKLVVTYNVGFVELDGTEASHIFEGMFYLDYSASWPTPANRVNGVCSHYPYGAYGKGKIGLTDNGAAVVYNPNGDYTGDEGGLANWKAYLAAQKAAGTPVQIAYQLATPETYATDPLDIDNASGPLTVMTGGEVEVRMTELVGSRSPELTHKLDKTGDGSNVTAAFTEAEQDADIQTGEELTVLFGKIKKRFSVVNKLVNGAVYPNLGTNTNFPDAINQRGKTTYTGDNTSPYCIDRWRISNGTTYTVGTFTLSAATYANRACGMWQSNEMGAHQLSIGDDITVSIYANGKLHTPTMKVIDRDLYDAFANVPAGYDCDDFEIVLCTYAKDKTKYNLGIYPKKLLSVNYIKWEKGSAATPYVPKSYRAELAECQRYFYRIYNSTWQTGSLISGWGFIVPFDTPVPMRSNPTINFVDAGLKVFAPSGWVNATSAETYGFNKNCARVNVKLIITLPSDIEGRSMLVTGIESFSADF